MTERYQNRDDKIPERDSTFLRAEDQRTIATILAGLALLIACCTSWYAYQCGGLVHIDRRPENQVTFQVDINQADWTELSALPNIGEKMARRIVAFRDKNGAFTSLQSVALVDGIGIHTIESIQPFVAGLPRSDELIAKSK